jgi:transcriptional regulator with XRE-family HTH domain
VSIAFESGPRLRPIDVSSDDGDEIAIDGTRLRQERIERGLSVSEAARLVTLSREQVEQIENGGLGAFYGARHKLLAVRKYADGFGLSLEDLMPDVRPAVEPASLTVTTVAAMQVPDMPVAALRAVTNDQGIATSEPLEATGSRLPLALLVGVALVLAFSILRGLTSASTPVESQPEPAASVATDNAAPVQVTVSPAVDSGTAAADAQDRWPAHRRRRGVLQYAVPLYRGEQGPRRAHPCGRDLRPFVENLPE